jgi:uncharacterized damage-inducible protein DinB
MTQQQKETREQEVARVRSYLASQSMRRTPEQVVEAVREAHRQFLEATASVPEAAFRTSPQVGEWSAADVLAHVCTVATFEERAIRTIVERGEKPPDVPDVLEPAPLTVTREDMLATLEKAREQMFAVALKADPEAYLDITCGHREFGQMNWREWLLFSRVHALDHAHQMQSIATAVTE